MKREILCVECEKETRGIIAGDITAEDVKKAGGAISLPLPIPEEVKKVSGYALAPIRCDFCNRIIEEGEYCVARSIIGYGQTYTPWESRYIKTFQPKENATTHLRRMPSLLFLMVFRAICLL